MDGSSQGSRSSGGKRQEGLRGTKKEAKRKHREVSGLGNKMRRWRATYAGRRAGPPATTSEAVPQLREAAPLRAQGFLSLGDGRGRG